jgi:type II secretory pathway component GspD/PulD (secretin)
MKYLSLIKIQVLTTFIVLNFNLQAKSLKDNIFPPVSSLEKIYLSDEGELHTLIFEFTGTKSDDEIDYKIDENFAPPSLILSFDNVSWRKGNFTKKSDNSPLYQYSLNIPRDSNQKEKIKRAIIKLDFTRIPNYSIKLVQEKLKSSTKQLKISWKKKKSKKKNKRYLASSKRLPDSRVTMNFKNAELANVVRLLVSQDNLNLIMGDDIKGKVTVNLEDVALESALDAILHVNRYEWFIQDNIIIVQPMKTKQVLSGELRTQMFRLNYITGSLISDAVSEVLTSRGKLKALSSTAASNIEAGEKDILLVTDVPTNFSLIEGVVRSLDIQSEQINIAVKFIETKLKHDEIIGINWDLRQKMDIVRSNNVDSSSTLDLGYLLIGGQTMNFATLSRPIVSAIMSLLANDGDTKLLQEPQVTTANNSPANILIGTTIPVLVPQGAGSVFGTNPYTYENQEVNVSLDVLPRTNKDRVISMKIDAVVQEIIALIGKDQRPMISTRSTSTSVRVNDGETLLIGGLIFDSANKLTSKVPILGDIPIIKTLFNYKNTDREQKELLIFITPTVVSSSK